MATDASLPDDVRALLVHMDWVRRLARRLVTDADLAEDAAQETWLAAAEHPPRHGANPRAWLGRVLQNSIRQLRRSEAARAGRERAVGALASERPSDAELHRSMGVQRHVADCVMALDEPYRRTVILRYFRDLSPQSIAAQEELPVATVKTRLRRALTQLRERLDRDHDGDRGAWLAALAPLAGIPTTHGAVGAGALIVSSKSSALALVAALVIVLSGIWLATSDQPELEDSVAAPGDSIEEVTAELEDTRTPGAAPEHVARQAADTTAADPAGAAGVRLRVVERESGAPVPDVEVRYAEQAAVGKWYQGDTEELLAEVGRRVVADGSGEAVLADLASSAYAVARHGDLYGELVIPADPEETLVMELLPDRTITIQVVDEAGTPLAGVPVGVKLKGNRSSQHFRWRARTGEDGTATCTHAHHRFPTIRAEGHVPYAGLDATLTEHVEVLLDLSAPASEPVRLVLAATGSVTVLLEDAAGQPTSDTWVYVYPLVRNDARGDRLEKGPRHDVHSKDGRAVFSHVVLGVELEISAEPSAEYKRVVSELPGPTEPGEELVHRLRFAESWPLLVGRALSAPDEPVARKMLGGRIQVHTPDGETHEDDIWVQTDEDGRFRIPVNAEPDVRTSCAIHLRTGVGESPALSADLEHVLEPGETDVGDVLLGEPPVVLAGRITNQDGEPLYWAHVDIARKRYYGEENERWTWDWIGGLRAIADEDGNFACTGEVEAGEYLYMAMATDHLDTELLPFQPGTRDLHIELLQVGGLAGSLRAPEGIAPMQVGIDVHPSGEPNETRNWQRWVRRPRPDGTFEIEDLAPGLVDVHLRLDATSPPVLEIEGVRIEPGETCRDPRLQGIDLRSKLRRIELVVVDSGGSPVSPAHVSVRPEGDDEQLPVHTVFEDGDVTVVTAAAAVDLELRAPGFRTLRLSGVRDDRRIVLEEGIPLRVTLPDDVPLPEPPLVLRLAVVPTTDHARSYEEHLRPEDSERYSQWLNWIHDQASRFGPERELTLYLSEEGTHSVRWLLERDVVGGDRWGVEADRDGTVLEISAGAGEAGVELAPDRASLQDALKRIE